MAWRMLEEGAKVAVYIHHPKHRRNYEGMMERIGLGALRKTLKGADQVIFDITHPNHRKPQDMALLKMFGLKTSSPSVFGPVADKLKKDHQVIACSEWSEEIELDRKLGSDIAQKIGMSIPETHDFRTLGQGVKFLQGRKDRWVLKPHDNADLDLTYLEKYPGELFKKFQSDLRKRAGEKFHYLLQRVVDGVEISTEGWFDGERWKHFNHTIEDKRLMTGNLGMAIGSAGNTVWMKGSQVGKPVAQGLLAEQFTRLTPWLKKAGYVGPVDINAIVAADRQPYFLEFSPRCGYDALYCLLTLLETSLTEFFTQGFKGKFGAGFASSQRLSIPPYPYASLELLANMAKGVPIEGNLTRRPWFWAEDVKRDEDGQLCCAGADGILGVATGRGSTVKEAVGEVYRHLRGLKVGAYLQYRVDGVRRPEKALEKLAEWRVQVR
jgi:phosphoribosylamine-glycine ligase